ncbi:DUF5050 domain-containing protein [Paenibacillus sp. 1_12]|uniref:DUF5050 domain-containing protein n=1 Tax=Paenibacillus sp. 1_12 TaxID=1566278 RepID=UPI00210BF736|nr:DUF5050 domain-containing protein [Paenibacillus sp. 1_12]
MVKLNGNKVDNAYREYPLFVYKDITYFPMTWYDSRLLGLEAEWTPKGGLNIVKGKVTSSYAPYITNHKNSTSYKATIPSFEITVNGAKVDNSKQEYPLLSLNEIIYFPLTWKFAHDAFGWEYVWDDAEGFAINSNNPHMQTVNLPAAAGDNGVALFNGYYYFTEPDGGMNQIYRVPENNTSSKEQVFAYVMDSSRGYHTNLKFSIRDHELWFSYHEGGGIMGSDKYGKVNDKGKAELEHQGYLDFKNTPNGALLINQSVPPRGNNLKSVPTGQEVQNGKNVGNPDLIYGWHITNNGSSTGYGTDRSTTIVGDDIYVLASSFPDTTGDINKIYKINLKTNKTEKILNAEVSHFKMVNNKLYYVKDEDHLLYSSNMDGTNEQQRSVNPAANWYDEVAGNVYYTVANTNGQFNLYKAESSTEDKLVLQEPVESVQLMNDQIICKLAAGEDYGIKIFDKSGNIQLSITDQAADIFVNDDVLLIVSKEDKSIKLIK